MVRCGRSPHALIVFRFVECGDVWVCRRLHGTALDIGGTGRADVVESRADLRVNLEVEVHHAVLEHIETLAGMCGSQNLRLALGEVEQLLEVREEVARLLQNRHEGRVLEHVARLLAVEDAREVLRDGIDVEVPFTAAREEAVDLAAGVGAVEQELELVDDKPGSPAGTAVRRYADPDVVEDDEQRQRLELAGQLVQIEAH